MNLYQEMLPVWQSWVGLQVRKVSPKPFKSGGKVNTVTGIIVHPFLKPRQNEDAMCFTFAEDDSYVECRRCELVE